jgi:hypothetical protein
MAAIPRVVANTLLVVASVAFSFAALEIGMRAAHDLPLVGGPNFIGQALDLVRSNSGAMDFDDRIGWRLKENQGAPGSGYMTTRFGIRANGVPMLKLPAAAILAVGDSFTAGSGVKDEETWPAQLERGLGRPVINAAAGAYGVDQMVLRAELLAPALRPSVLIVGILGQDSLRNSYDVYGGGAKPWFDLEGSQLVLKGVPVRRLEQSNRGLGVLRSVFGHSYLLHWTMTRLGLLKYWIDDSRRYHRVLSDKDGVRVSCLLMDRLNEFKGQFGSEVLIVMLWGAQEATWAEPSWYGAEVVACARKAGHRTLDMHASLHSISRSDPEGFKQLWIDEGGVLGHPSAAGNELTAKALQAMLSAPRSEDAEREGQKSK